MENPKHFKLYLNSSNKKVWDIINECQKKGISPSDYLCKKILEDQQPVIETPKPKSLIERLIEIAREYEDKGIDGLDISYKLPYLYKKEEISKEDMIDLILFTQKLKITIEETGNFLEIFNELPIDSKRDIMNKDKMVLFKKLLQFKLVAESEKLDREQKQREKQRRLEEFNQKREEEVRQWLLDNPGKEYWMKGLSDEEVKEQLEQDSKILSGEWIIEGVNDDNEPEEGDEYND